MKTLPARKANTLQIVGYTIATIVLATAAALAISIYFYQRKPLKLAVGPKDGIHHRFALRLAEVVEANTRTLHVVVTAYESSTDAIGALNRGDADLAIARSETRLPSSARAVAHLETDVVFVATPRAQKLSSLAALRGKRIALQGSDPRDETLVRRVLDGFDLAGTYTLAAAPADAPIERLFTPAGHQVVIGVTPLSKLIGGARHEGMGRRVATLDIIGVDGGKALERRVPGVFSETISAGMISTAPRWPAEDMDTIALHHFLLARAKVASRFITDLTRAIFENKEDLALANEFATHIETPDKEKDAFVLAHQGAADYVEDEVKGFLERYSDLFYIGTTAAGIIGSLFLAMYTWLTKVEPVRASAMAGEIAAIAARARKAATTGDLDIADGELEELLRLSLGGLQSGALSAEGLDVFRLAYDDAHRAILAQRKALEIGGATPANAAPVNVDNVTALPARAPG